MRIVEKFKKGAETVALREIRNNDAKSLYWVFVKNKGSPAQKQRAESIAEFMKDQDGWLECSCDAESPPLMTIGLSVKGNYYLQRINSRGKHHQKCDFKGVDRPNISGAGEIKPCSKRKPLRLHRRGAIEESETKKTSRESNNSGTSSKYPRLAQVLYTWIEEAGLNTLSVFSKESISDRFESLRSAASSYQLEKGIKASRFLWTYPDVEQMALRLEKTKNQWPENSRPYALCIAVADQIDGKTLRFVFKEKTIEVTLLGDVKQSSGRIGAHSGPFLVVFTVTDTTDEKGVYKPLNAFYVPVYSKFQLIPVDSVYERRVLTVIEQRARWWTKDQRLKARVIKPLFDIKEFCNGELQASRPDFLIETPKKRIIFEVMGSHEDDYQERKERTVEYMRAIGDVIEFDALNADKTGCWDENLKQHISRLSAMVFKGNGR